jgi:hypothetical protein
MDDLVRAKTECSYAKRWFLDKPPAGVDSRNSVRFLADTILIPLSKRVVGCILFLRLPVVHQNEFLDPLARINFPGIETTGRIRHYLMKPMKLPGIAAIVPCLAQDNAILSPEGPDDVVLAVGYQQKLLVLVG